MAQAKKAEAKAPAKLEVVLPTASSKKHSVRFETDQQGAPVTNLYLGLDGLRQLGNPSAIKVTIEAHEE